MGLLSAIFGGSKKTVAPVTTTTATQSTLDNTGGLYVGAGGQRGAVRGHHDLNRALAVWRLVRALFQQLLDSLLQLRVKVSLGLLDKDEGEFVTIAEQHQPLHDVVG